MEYILNVEVVDRKEQPVAFIFPRSRNKIGTPSDEAWANARLIAAAPEMFNLLKALSDEHIIENSDYRARIEEIIKPLGG
jgi:hypothetical protein